jgi:cell division GTPase FtsZ
MSEELMNFELPVNRSSIIKVIGIGGGGSNAVNHMWKQGISKEEAFEILYKFIKREDLAKPHISKVVKLDKEGVSALRKIYDNAPVEQKYSYGYEKFGFFLEDIRVDVDPAHLEIKKININ